MRPVPPRPTLISKKTGSERDKMETQTSKQSPLLCPPRLPRSPPFPAYSSGRGVGASFPLPPLPGRGEIPFPSLRTRLPGCPVAGPALPTAACKPGPPPCLLFPWGPETLCSPWPRPPGPLEAKRGRSVFRSQLSPSFGVNRTAGWGAERMGPPAQLESPGVASKI